MAATVERSLAPQPNPVDMSILLDPAVALFEVSPMAGRYPKESARLSPWLSEFGIIRARIFVESELLKAYSGDGLIPSLSPEEIGFLDGLSANLDLEGGKRVKALEKKADHDVVAAVNYMKEKLQESPHSRLVGLVY